VYLVYLTVMPYSLLAPVCLSAMNLPAQISHDPPAGGVIRRLLGVI